jgi:oxalate decarboxylase/phosphoglucose isomerase-like protein (cupin superfamily)
VELFAGAAALCGGEMDGRQSVSRKSFTLLQLLEQRAGAKKPYLEFLRVPTLSAGVFVLEPGARDTQQPHVQDEVYYVAGGRARLMLEEGGTIKTIEATPGTIIFVPAGARHAFYNITDGLQVLAFFAPAEPLETMS